MPSGANLPSSPTPRTPRRSLPGTLGRGRRSFWFTFSADPETFKAYYPGLSTPEIDQLLNWGPITFVPTVPFVSWLLMQENGLRKCMRLNACLCFTACALRFVPCLVSAATRERHQWLLLLLHLAQILNGIAGPVLIAAPSRLSALWFPPHQRTTVTAVANASFVGAAIGFFLCPAVLNDNPDNVPHLLLITLGLACAPILRCACSCSARHLFAPVLREQRP